MKYNQCVHLQANPIQLMYTPTCQSNTTNVYTYKPTQYNQSAPTSQPNTTNVYTYKPTQYNQCIHLQANPIQPMCTPTSQPNTTDVYTYKPIQYNQCVHLQANPIQLMCTPTCQSNTTDVYTYFTNYIVTMSHHCCPLHYG